MQFTYHENAGEALLKVDIRVYEHLFKVRRLKEGSTLWWRNLCDENIYEYCVQSIGKKEAILELLSTKSSSITSLKKLHIGWCVIDPKIIEKTLPMLNELGVECLNFIYADFSQKNHLLDQDRMKRILINSSQQCGRSTWMQLQIFDTLEAYFRAYPKSAIVDFSTTKLSDLAGIASIIIGPEGGFSERERALFANTSVFGLSCPTILRSETAVVSVASKILA